MNVRFESVDALRGLAVAAMLLVNNPGDWSHIYAPLAHSPWHGFTPTDLIFPLFLFVVGVSIALGPVTRRDAGAATGALRREVWRRALRIVALGLLLHAVAWWLLEIDAYRPWGVLQRIGICYAAAAWLAIHADARLQWAVTGLLLGAYALLLALGGSLAPLDNVVSRVDTALLGRHLYQFDAALGRGHDPEGLLSTVPAIATTLLGVRAGDWLRHGRGRWMWLGGAGLLLCGALWSLWLPLNKNLWTPSFVLWTGGLSALALALMHELVDRRRWPAWGRSLGRNAIVAYAGSALVVYLLAALDCWEPAYRIGFAGWMTPTFDPRVPSLLFALSFVGLWWLLAHAMAGRGWHLRL